MSETKLKRERKELIKHICSFIECKWRKCGTKSLNSQIAKKQLFKANASKENNAFSQKQKADEELTKCVFSDYCSNEISQLVQKLKNVMENELELYKEKFPGHKFVGIENSIQTLNSYLKDKKDFKKEKELFGIINSDAILQII